jgi:hypothetical protein
MEGDWSDARVTGNTDRTQQTIELINRIEMLEKQLEIATRYLGLYADDDNWINHMADERWAKLAFAEIERVVNQ